MLVVCAYAFKSEEFFGLADIQAKMTYEQRETYIINHTALALMLSASILSTLVVSFGLFISQVAHEGEQMRREARVTKGRRLRFVDDGREVTLPDWHCPSNSDVIYHLFLSHVWGDGEKR